MEHYKKSLKSDRLQQILDCFVELTGIRAAYFDNSIEYASGKHKEMCTFCKIIREFSFFDEGCKASDNNAFNYVVQSGKTHLYKCPMGLWEAVVPIFVKSRFTGYLMLGQVKGTDGIDNWSEIQKLLSAKEIDVKRISEIREHYFNMSVFDESKIEAAAKMLEIIAQHIIDSDVIHIYDSEIVEKVKVYLENHFIEHVSTKKLAQLLNLSQSSLCQIFKKETGKTITGYIEDLRIRKAAELLSMSSLSIKEISALSGFSDQNYFSRVFKKVQKCSPVKYRENIKK